MARIPLVTRDSLPEDELTTYDEFVAQRGSEPTIGPYSVIAHIPGIALRLDDLRKFLLRTEPSLPQPLQELAMLTVAREMNCGFIWYAHAASARQAGLRGDIIDSIREKRPLADLTTKELAVVSFTRELLQNRKVSQAAFDAASVALGKRGLLVLTNIITCYAVLAYNMNAYEVQPPLHPTEPTLPV